MARSGQPAGRRLTITHVLFSPQSMDGRRAGLAGSWLSLPVWGGSAGGAPGFSAPLLVHAVPAGNPARKRAV
jgi:hypothetical protein